MPSHQEAPATRADILARLFGLEGQVAVVAGGAGRIGRTLCHALAEAGASVCVLDSDGPRAQELAEQVGVATGRRTIATATDVTQPEQLAAAVERVTSQLGPPGILVNACQFRGQGFYSSSVDDYPLAAWNEVMSVNLTGVYLTCQAFGRAMAVRGGGAIVNLASTYGLVSPDPRVYGDSGVNSPVSYGASKAGVIQLTRYLAVHWRERNIRINCLVPGGVFDGQDEAFVRAYSQRTPLGRMAQASDYQGAVLFMVSPASAYMTGAVVTVDGGWTAW
jgi:NAD(P)-dependent dehydrogenase (short-subunit alcohol dehydrogenase family)